MMKIISFVVLVLAVIVLVGVFLDSGNLFSGFTGGGFNGFANALNGLLQALATPIILGMLGLIGLCVGRRNRQ